jgi:hypothetical protein
MRLPFQIAISARNCLFLGLISLAIWTACESTRSPSGRSGAVLDRLAEQYVRLVLQAGQYDPDFVDAYYGPEEWKPAAGESDSQIPPDLAPAVDQLIDQLDQIHPEDLTLDEKLRHTLLKKQAVAVVTRIRMLEGEKFLFDEEARLLYDAEPPHFDTIHFNQLLARLDSLVPGHGKLQERYEQFSRQFIIPVERLDTVFQVAISEARKRTREHLDLPENENFQIEYVTGKSWSGYNYYKGNSYSVIQINTDLPIYIERAIDLACHEGYPGHHVFNALLEKNLVQDKGWMEFSIYPLFSPQSLIAEGSANYGIEMAFPGREKVVYEKEVLYPLAGLDTTLAETYERIQQIRKQLDYAGNEAARQYLNGAITRESAAKMLEKYLMYEPSRALQRTRFFDQYRSYVVNYNLGKDLVAAYVDHKTGQEGRDRWSVFQELLSLPLTASMLTD